MSKMNDKETGAAENDTGETERSEAIEAELLAKMDEDEMPADPTLGEQKKSLEVEKLRAEVDEIRARTKGPSATVARWSGIAGLMLTIIGLGAGGAGLYYGYQDFSTLSENEAERRARQLDFEVGREIIELSQNLSDADKTKRTSAAILLSAYEEHSVPILVSNLPDQDAALTATIVRSLGLILEKPRLIDKPEKVAVPLINETRSMFDAELKRASPETRDMGIFVDALGTLFAGSRNQGVLDALKDLKVAVTRDSLAPALRAKLDNVERKIDEAHAAVAASGG